MQKLTFFVLLASLFLVWGCSDDEPQSIAPRTSSTPASGGEDKDGEQPKQKPQGKKKEPRFGQLDPGDGSNQGIVGIPDDGEIIFYGNDTDDQSDDVITPGKDNDQPIVKPDTPVVDKPDNGNDDQDPIVDNNDDDNSNDPQQPTPATPNELLIALGKSVESTGEQVSEVLEQGANIDVRDENQRTPLMNAALNNNMSVVNALLENGADWEAVDSDNESVLDLLRDLEESHSNVILAIQEKAYANPTITLGVSGSDKPKTKNLDVVHSFIVLLESDKPIVGEYTGIVEIVRGGAYIEFPNDKNACKFKDFTGQGTMLSCDTLYKFKKTISAVEIEFKFTLLNPAGEEVQTLNSSIFPKID
jgi:hypothetical protein